MKGYSKIKGNNSFLPRSNSNKEFLFLDKDFELLSSKSINKKPHLHEHGHEYEQSNFGEKNRGDDKRNEFFIGRTEEYNDDDDDHHHHSLKNEGGERIGGVLWRNLSVSSSTTTTPSYQKNNIKGNNNNNNINGNLERQSSTRSIQEAVKRAFSIKRSTSVNYDRYSRIYDQPMNVDDGNYVNDDDYNHHNDDDVGRNGSLETTRSVSMMKKNKNHNGRKHVGSKVMRACKRLFI